MRAVIFGGPPALAVRTARACARLGVEVALAPTLGAALAREEACWLLRAGAWTDRPVEAPLPSATGRPLVALGAELGAPSEGTRAWSEVLRRTGGDLEGLGALPPVWSAWVDRAAARALAETGATGLEDAILRARGLRVVRVAALDVHHDRQLRVLQVTTSLQQGGAERIVLGLVHGLRGAGVSCELALIGRPTRRSWPAPSGTHELSELRGRPEQAEALVELAHRFGADVVHLHLLEGPLVAALARGGSGSGAADGRPNVGLPLAITVHNARPGWPAGLEALEPEAAPLVIACANAVLRELGGTPLGRRARTIRNATDAEVWSAEGARWAAVEARGTPAPGAEARSRARSGRAPHASRADLGIPDDALVLLAVANPRPQKRLHLLPLVARAVASRTARAVHVVLAGAPSGLHADAAEAHRALVETARGAEVPLHELGSVELTRATYRLADVLVSTSAWEGLSVAQLEALACGVPVVATDVGGTRELPGVTCVPADATPEHFADVIVARLAAPERAQLPEAFTMPALVERHVRLYRRSVAPRTPRGIWLVTNNFSVGGAQSSARRLLVALAAAGVPVRAAVIEEHRDHPTPGRSALVASGVPVLVLPHAATNPAQVTVDALLDAMDEAPPAAVLFWNLIAEHKVRLADALLDARVIDVSPGEMFHASLHRTFARARWELPYETPADYGARLHAVVVKHHGEVDAARALLGAPVHVIPNGVPLDRPPPERQALDRLPDDAPAPDRPQHAAPAPDRAPRGPELRFVTAARLAPQKRLEDLIDALHLAAPALAEVAWSLDVLGGPERGAEAYADDLRARAAALPVRWCGEETDPRPALERADVMLMISEPAGCPNASLEAMAAGLPVIATDVGGAREQVRDRETGLLVPPRDPHALAAAIVALAHDRAWARALGRGARAHVERSFSLDAMVRAYRAVAGV